MIAAVVVVGVVVGPVTSSGAQPTRNPLKGVWKVVEVSGGIEGTNTSPQASLYIFTDRYYSIMRVSGTKPRPAGPAGRMTEAERLASADAFVANAGSYRVSGSAVSYTAIVAKNESVMGQSRTATIEVDKDVIWWTAQTPPDQGVRLKFQRIE